MTMNSILAELRIERGYPFPRPCWKVALEWELDCSTALIEHTELGDPPDTVLVTIWWCDATETAHAVMSWSSPTGEAHAIVLDRRDAAELTDYLAEHFAN